MVNIKNWYQSKGIQGGLVALVGGMFLLGGVEISQIELQELIATLFSVVGSVVAIYGRVVASTQIK